MTPLFYQVKSIQKIIFKQQSHSSPHQQKNVSVCQGGRDAISQGTQILPGFEKSTTEHERNKGQVSKSKQHPAVFSGKERKLVVSKPEGK